MHNKFILLFFVFYLLPLPLSFSETEISYNYVTPPIDDNFPHSHEHYEFFDEDLFSYQVNNIDPNINQDRMNIRNNFV